MLAAVLVRPREFELKELEIPEPASDEVRMKGRILRDLFFQSGSLERRSLVFVSVSAGAPGHESVGVVDQLGTEVTGLKVGQHVSMLGNSGFAEY